MSIQQHIFHRFFCNSKSTKKTSALRVTTTDLPFCRKLHKHTHASAVEVQLKKLITLIDRKTGERTQEHPRFIKQDQVAIARFELSQSGQVICMEPFKRFPQLGRFTLRDEGRTVAVGKVLKIIE